MDEETLQKIVDLSASKVDQPFYIVSGNFLARFSTVEISLTSIIAVLCDMYDLKTFHILTKGMDARVKIERLRQLARKEKGIGPEFKQRLDFFENKIIPMRNDLAHGSLWRNETEFGKWHVLAIDSFQDAGFEDDQLDNAPKAYLAQDIYARAKWCELFHQELAQIFAHARSKETLEIDRPLLRAPKDNPESPRQPKRSSSPRKPHQTRV